MRFSVRVLLGVLAVLAQNREAAAQALLQPEDLRYLGAFRLPDDGERPRTFAWGGNAMSFRPGGDGGAGSLFVTGHDRLAYGELPDGNQLAEISIPAPVIAADPAALPVARFVQPFTDAAAGHFAGLDELPRVGIAYLDTPETGPRLHLAWGQHFQPDPAVPSHGSVAPDLAAPDFLGEWFLETPSDYAANGYMFEIPQAWAGAHAGGRRLATGRFRDGGWSGMGPALFAYRPWDDSGTPAADGTRLEAVTLLHYRASDEVPGIEGALTGYQHPDEWEGGAWIGTTGGKTAVLFAGTKAVGAKYWYGYVHPDGPDRVCVAEEYAVCHMAGGGACPAADLVECEGHNDYRGWWTNAWEARILLYDPADLARVAAGEWEAWRPQPYAMLALDEHLFLNPAGIEPDMLGRGPQQRYRIGSVAYDRAGDRLFVLEMFADGDKPVVHVWGLR